MTKGFNRGLAGLLMSATLLAGAAATAAELPKATQQMLKALNISPDDKIVANLNEEANSTPPDILAAANKEGEVNISGSINDEEFRELIAPFRERFPNVKVKYFSADQNDRQPTRRTTVTDREEARWRSGRRMRATRRGQSRG